MKGEVIMDAATYLVTYAFLTNIQPAPLLLLMAIAIRFGWNVAHDIGTRRRIEQRFNQII
ncbi:hypothetical protein DC522_04880 [Microvirga sp. KLBC 81]|nr:hypothetical protein DC522_04880 [Microvirga sp. KLBC 81]